jgi:hypothetical protein
MSDPRQPVTTAARDLGWFVAIGVTAALVRLSFAWQYAHQPLGQYAWVDESSYWTWAQAISRGGWWPLRPFYQDPLYPYWLAWLMAVVGTDVATLRVASAGLGAVTPLVVAWVGRAGLGRIEGLLAGWATALYAPLIFADGSLEKEGLAAFWTALALWMTAHLARSGRPMIAAAGGASWGVVALLRSNALVIAPLAAVWLAVSRGERPGHGRARRLGLALAYLAGFFVVLAPVAAINSAVSSPREFLGTTWQLGPNFFIGNGPGATGTYVAPHFIRGHPAFEAADYAMEAMRRTGRPLTVGEVSRFWLNEGLRQWASAPLASIRLLGWKLALLAHRLEIPDNQDIEFVQIVAAPSLAWGIVHFGIVFPLAVVGLARVPRTSFWVFLNLATWLGLAATAVFFVVGRYRVPWVPGMVLLAAAGLVDLGRLIKAGDWQGLTWRLGVLLLPAALLSWRPQTDPVPTRWGNQLIALAVANLRNGDVDIAIDALDLARASSPEIAAKVRQRSDDGPFRELLVEAIDRELGSRPILAADAPTAIHQARLLRQLRQRSARARSLLEEILRSSPGDRAAQRELGALLLSWPSQPHDAARASESLEQACSPPEFDTRAALILALATTNPAVLTRMAVPADQHLVTFTRLVRAMLASRDRQTRAS